jgi:predicted transcriptional regulator
VKGPLDWGRWALKQGELYGLSDGEARVLSVLAAHVNRDGVTVVEFLTEAEIGRRVQRSDRTVRRLLARLRDRGLLTSEQRGRTVARHRLHDVLPVEQLSLDTAFDRSPVTGRPTGQPVNSLSTLTGQAVDRQEREEDVAVVAVGAHAPDADPPNTATSDGVLHPKLDEVLAIFRALPDPYRHVEPASIDSAMQAHAGVDVVSAAHIVASKVHAGQAHTSHVNTLFLGVLRRMPSHRDRDTPPAAAPAAGGHPAPATPRRGRQPKSWDGALQRAIADGSPA